MDLPSTAETLTHNAPLWLPHRYWGKARPGIAGSANYHPLPYHSLDVAAVSASWWNACTPSAEIE